MAALTQAKMRRKRGAGMRERLAIATSSTLYLGSLVNRRNSTGRALAATAATGRRVAGVAVALHSTVNGPNAGTGVGNASGTEEVEIEYGNEHLMTVKTALRTTTHLGLNFFVGDDDMVAGTGVGTAATRLAVGRVVAFEDSAKTTAWVALLVFGKSDIGV